MNVVVPFTKLHPNLLTVLEQQGVIPWAGRLRQDDSYWHLLRKLWENQETVIVVEHDILPWPGALQELWDCPKPWCSYSYHRRVAPAKSGVGDFFGFGCVKWSGEFMAENPNLFEDMENHHWSQLDTQFEHATWKLGIRPHHHRPAVLHVKP